MKRTYLKAKEMAKTGDFNKAWEIAKFDEGLNESTTKEQWITWIKTKIK